MASFENAVDGQYITMVLTSRARPWLRTLRLVGVRALDPAGSGLPSDLSLPIGLVEFAVEGLSPGSAVDVEIFVHSDIQEDSRYLKYGSERMNPRPHWYDFTDYDDVVGAEIDAANDRITLRLVDGDPSGDDDQVANGKLADAWGLGWSHTWSLGEIFGTVFNDANGNAQYDSVSAGGDRESNEQPMQEAVTVWIDMNGNDTYDTWEPKTQSDPVTGEYSFVNLPWRTRSSVRTLRQVGCRPFRHASCPRCSPTSICTAPQRSWSITSTETLTRTLRRGTWAHRRESWCSGARATTVSARWRSSPPTSAGSARSRRGTWTEQGRRPGGPGRRKDQRASGGSRGFITLPIYLGPDFLVRHVAIGDIDGQDGGDVIFGGPRGRWVDYGSGPEVEKSALYAVLQNPDGTFPTTPTEAEIKKILPTNLQPQNRFYIASDPLVVDLDGDGDQDIAVAATLNTHTRELAVLSNDGSGEFSLVGMFPCGGDPVAVTAHDMDADGDLDLVTGNAGGTVSVFHSTCAEDGSFDQQGGGTFGTAVSYNAGVGPRDVLVADMNADGRLDIVVAAFDADPGTLAVLTGLDDGTFGRPYGIPAGDTPRAVDAVDVNGDDVPDVLAVANHWPDTVTVLTPNPSQGTSSTAGWDEPWTRSTSATN